MRLKDYKFFIILLVSLLIAVWLSLTIGSQYIPLTDLWKNSQFHDIVISIRLPRTLNAITVGALLSMAGLMIQNLVKNPLADPYILGISGASASVQIIILALGISLPFWLFAGIGFFASILSLLVLLKISTHKKLNTNNLLLSGVVIAFAYGAVISFVLTVSPLSSTKPMLYWLMGDLGYADVTLIPILALIIGCIWAFLYHKELDLLARGEFFAQKCGVDCYKINIILLVTASVFTAIAVSMAGTIGFVGLVVPHMARLLVGNVHSKLIPLSALIGALVLLIADTISRSIIAPIQLPVGIFTAFFGVPLFLYLLAKKA